MKWKEVNIRTMIQGTKETPVWGEVLSESLGLRLPDSLFCTYDQNLDLIWTATKYLVTLGTLLTLCANEATGPQGF